MTYESPPPGWSQEEWEKKVSYASFLKAAEQSFNKPKRPHQVRNTLIVTGVVVLVAIILFVALYIPPTGVMDEYMVSRVRFGDAQYGPIVERLQWLLTPIHVRMVEFGLAPDWWSWRSS